MTRRRPRTSSSKLALGAAALLLAGNARSATQREDTLVHQPAPCMDTETFPLIEARTTSSVDELAVRFRSEDSPDWHEIALEPQSETLFRGALLRPRPEAARVHYYFVWGRPEQRSREYVVNVLMGGCPGERNAAAEMTDGIRVRRTANGQDELPRGFNPEGVARGPSSRLTLGMVAGGVAGAGVAAIVISGGEVVESPPPPDPGAPRACFTPDPVPDINSRDTIRFDASCTTPATVTAFEWDFGDGATAQGSSVEHVFVPGGIYTVTLTVRDGARSDSVSRVVRVIATPTACFVTNPNPPRISARQSIDFNAECSMGDRDGGPTGITRYEWDFGDDRPGTEGVFVSRQFPQPDVYGVTLTVTNEDGRRHKTTQFVVVEQGSTSTTGTSTLSLTSLLELPRGTTATIALNGTETVTTSAASYERYRLRARTDENVVEARLVAPSSTEGRWQFDFADTPGFEASSLTVESGQVLALDARRVVFRVGEGDSTPIRFRFRLRE